MKRLIALLTLAAVALLPASALAKPRAKVYRGTFAFVGADGDYVTGHFGKAQLVDGKRNDKLSVHVRRLAPRTKYVFRLQRAGIDVPGWKYRRGGVLRTNRKGVANSSARSRTFTGQTGVTYVVAVYAVTPSGSPGPLVLRAELRTKGKKPHPKAKPPKTKPAKGHDKPAKARGHQKGPKD
jgi:hypothetical protein